MKDIDRARAARLLGIAQHMDEGDAEGPAESARSASGSYATPRRARSGTPVASSNRTPTSILRRQAEDASERRRQKTAERRRLVQSFLPSWRPARPAESGLPAAPPERPRPALSGSPHDAAAAAAAAALEAGGGTDAASAGAGAAASAAGAAGARVVAEAEACALPDCPGRAAAAASFAAATASAAAAAAGGSTSEASAAAASAATTTALKLGMLSAKLAACAAQAASAAGGSSEDAVAAALAAGAAQAAASGAHEAGGGACEPRPPAARCQGSEPLVFARVLQTRDDAAAARDEAARPLGTGPRPPWHRAARRMEAHHRRLGRVHGGALSLAVDEAPAGGRGVRSHAPHAPPRPADERPLRDRERDRRPAQTLLVLRDVAQYRSADADGLTAPPPRVVARIAFDGVVGHAAGPAGAYEAAVRPWAAAVADGRRSLVCLCLGRQRRVAAGCVTTRNSNFGTSVPPAPPVSGSNLAEMAVLQLLGRARNRDALERIRRRLAARQATNSKFEARDDRGPPQHSKFAGARVELSVLEVALVPPRSPRARGSQSQISTDSQVSNLVPNLGGGSSPPADSPSPTRRFAVADVLGGHEAVDARGALSAASGATTVKLRSKDEAVRVFRAVRGLREARRAGPEGPRGVGPPAPRAAAEVVCATVRRAEGEKTRATFVSLDLDAFAGAAQAEARRRERAGTVTRPAPTAQGAAVELMRRVRALVRGAGGAPPAGKGDAGKGDAGKGDAKFDIPEAEPRPWRDSDGAREIRSSGETGLATLAAVLAPALEAPGTVVVAVADVAPWQGVAGLRALASFGRAAPGVGPADGPPVEVESSAAPKPPNGGGCPDPRPGNVGRPRARRPASDAPAKARGPRRRCAGGRPRNSKFGGRPTAGRPTPSAVSDAERRRAAARAYSARVDRMNRTVRAPAAVAVYGRRPWRLDAGGGGGRPSAADERCLGKENAGGRRANAERGRRPARGARGGELPSPGNDPGTRADDGRASTMLKSSFGALLRSGAGARGFDESRSQRGRRSGLSRSEWLLDRALTTPVKASRRGGR